MFSPINIELTRIAKGIDNCAPITNGDIMFEEFNDLSFEEIKKLCLDHNLKFKYDENAYLIRYNRYNDKCDIDNEFVKKFRGTVFDRKTNKCVCHTFQKALSCDQKSAFGGVVAFNRKIDEKLTKILNN